MFGKLSEQSFEQGRQEGNDTLGPKRRAKAVWRGSIGEPFITNGNWTSRKVLMQSHFSNKEWKRQGRLALVHQHCQHPQLLDVRVVEGYRLLNLDDPDFMSCTR